MKKVLRNLLVLAVGDVGSKLLGFVAIAYMARVFGPEGFGVVNIGLAILGYLALVVSPGVHLYGTRCVASGEVETSMIVGTVTRTRLAIAVLLVVGTSVYALSVSGGSIPPFLVLLFAGTLLPLSVSLEWYFQGRERMGVITCRRLILNGLYVLFLFLLVRERGDLIWVPIAFFIGNTGASAFLFFVFSREGRFPLAATLHHPRHSWERGRDLLRKSLPMGLGATLAQVSFNFPLLLLGFFVGPSAAGQYGAAMRIVFAFMILDRITSVVFYPLVSRFWMSDRGRLPHLSSQFMRMVMVVTFPTCILAFFLAPQIIAAVYGPQYDQAIVLLRVLIWFFLSTSLNTVFLFGLLAIGRERRYSSVIGWGTLVQVALMLVLVPVLGTVGVAVGFVLGEFAISVLSGRAYRALVTFDLPGSLLRPALSGVVMGLCLLIVPVRGLVAEIAVAMIIFLAMLILTGGIRREDMLLLRQEI